MNKFGLIKQINIPRDFSVVALFDVVAKILAAITSVLVIRLLSVEMYACYTRFSTIASLLFGVVGTSMGVAYARAGTEYTSRGYYCLKKIYNVCIIILLIITLALLLLTPLISKVYSVVAYVALLALVFGFLQSVNRLNVSYFQIRGKFAVAGLLDNAKHICLLVFFVGGVLIFGCEGIFLFIIFALSMMLPVIIGIVLIRTAERSASGDELAKETIRTIIIEASTLVLYGLLINLIDQTDILLVNNMLDENALSNYGVSLKYYQMLLTLQASLSTILRIKTSQKEIVDSNINQARFATDWIRKTGVFIFIVAVTANILTNPIMNLLNGNRYQNAIPAFRVFIIGASISYLFAPNTAVMMSAKRHKRLCVYAIVGLVINAVLDLLLIPRIGIIAAAIATVSGNAFINIASFFTVLKHGKKQILQHSS